MLFAIILMVLILVIFRKQKAEYSDEGSKTEIIFSFSWYLLYFALAMISNAFHINIINEVTNWLFFVLLPLLILARLKKGKFKEAFQETLREIGLKRIDKETGFRTLLVCMLYMGILVFVFSLSDEKPVITDIPKMLVRLPIFMCLMLLTAGFTEEFFFRGIVQRCVANSLKQPYIAIVFTSILFGLYHFPFAYYLWEQTAGSVVNSLKAILVEQAVTGCALGLMYYKSSNNLWSSAVLHAFVNASIMAFGTVLPGS